MRVCGALTSLVFFSCVTAFGQTSFWPTSTLPGTAEVTNDTASVTLGLRFSSEVAGVITGVRFYKGSHNTGTHVGHLWSETGTKLAEVTFTNETASGWQQANFATPVTITANSPYVVSYIAPKGYYSADQYYSWSALANAPLRVAGSAPGVFAYGAAGTFPTGTWNGTNYWVDVVFQPTVTAPAPGSPDDKTFWTSSATPGTPSASDRKTVTLGVKFSSDVAGFVKGVRFYKGRNNTGTHVGQLWSATGAKLAQVTFTNETAGGWQQANFSTPIAISANTPYVVSYVAPSGGYATDTYYSWSTLSAAPLRVSGTSPGVFSYNAGTAMPSSTWKGCNYWVDVVFVPQSTSGTTYTISGKVSGAAATVALSGAVSESTTTDGSGNYTFTGLPNGSYVVTPSQSGYVFSPVSKTVTIAGASVSAVNFTASTTAPATYTISGRVSGATATVALSGAVSKWTTTDGAGNYTISGLPNGSYVVTPGQSGYVFSPVSKSVTIAGASVSAVNFTASTTAPATYTISGRVSGSTATLTLSGTSGGTTTTDAAGNYTFAGLSNGSYVIAPSRTGYAFSPSTASVSIAGASAGGINFDGTAVISHSVSLTWVASTSADVSGYNVYRSITAGGPYAKLTPSIVSGTTYTDNNVSAGQTYYYVATAVAAGDNESIYSSEAAAAVPTP